MRGIRGATQIEANTVAAIEEGVAELCRALTAQNGIREDEIVWAIFTVTHDVDADFPARAARVKGGWDHVPMICSREIPVPELSGPLDGRLDAVLAALASPGAVTGRD